jgi:CheY-like chemotaxis protein
MSFTVLVVDDETDSADLLGMILEMQLPDATVHIAHGGQAALKLARQARPDAAVIDLEMPELDGEQLAAALRAQLTAGAPLLIALSGNVGRLAAISEKGIFDHHMSKPADIDGLVRILQKI